MFVLGGKAQDRAGTAGSRTGLPFEVVVWFSLGALESGIPSLPILLSHCILFDLQKNLWIVLGDTMCR